MKEEVYTLITGASEGFGKALAVECARRKMNLILAALPEPDLEHLAMFIRNNFNVKVHTFGTDLSNEQACHALHRQVKQKGLQVNMLINNAGIGGTLLFREGSTEFFSRQIKLNVLATTILTHLFLEQLTQHKQSYILNISSLSCFFFLAKKSVYGSTKAYLYHFSKSLGKELKPLGVSVSVLCPGGMLTNPSVTIMTNCGTWFTRNTAMKPEDVAPIAIDGLLKGKEVIIPGKMNKLFRLIDHILPPALKSLLANRQMDHLHAPPFLKNEPFPSGLEKKNRKFRNKIKLPQPMARGLRKQHQETLL